MLVRQIVQIMKGKYIFLIYSLHSFQAMHDIAPLSPNNSMKCAQLLSPATMASSDMS